MYLDFLVKIPFVQGKITRRKKKDVISIEYEYDRIYDPVRQYTFPKRVTIGKLSETDPELMQPNQNFLKYFRMQSCQRQKTGHPGAAACAWEHILYCVKL